jgi:pantetheine-phosphate adenylyltransferase
LASSATDFNRNSARYTSPMSDRRAVYAGSFDPITDGHLWMIEHGARLFDELIVSIGINPDKKYLFTLEDRLMMLREATAPFKNVRIASFENLFLVHYARQVDAGFILRGIRNEVDYGYERGMRYINAELNDGVLTTFLMPPREYAEISSSFVKGLVGPAGWEQVVQKYVPAGVHAKFLERFAKR